MTDERMDAIILGFYYMAIALKRAGNLDGEKLLQKCLEHENSSQKEKVFHEAIDMASRIKKGIEIKILKQRKVIIPLEEILQQDWEYDDWMHKS